MRPRRTDSAVRSVEVEENGKLKIGKSSDQISLKHPAALSVGIGEHPTKDVNGATTRTQRLKLFPSGLGKRHQQVHMLSGLVLSI
jgi:hypothetical protein